MALQDYVNAKAPQTLQQAAVWSQEKGPEWGYLEFYPPRQRILTSLGRPPTVLILPKH